MEVGGPYRVRQSMYSHVEHRSYDFDDPSMSCLSSPALRLTSFMPRDPLHDFHLVLLYIEISLGKKYQSTLNIFSAAGMNG